MGSLCAYMYLVCFGYIAMLFLLRAFGPRSRLVNSVLTIVLLFVVPPVFMILGFAYISLSFHDWIVGKVNARIAKEQKEQKGRPLYRKVNRASLDLPADTQQMPLQDIRQESPAAESFQKETSADGSLLRQEPPAAESFQKENSADGSLLRQEPPAAEISPQEKNK